MKHKCSGTIMPYFCHEPSNLIPHLGAVRHQPASDSVQHLEILLGDRLLRHWTGLWVSPRAPLGSRSGDDPLRGLQC